MYAGCSRSSSRRFARCSGLALLGAHGFGFLIATIFVFYLLFFAGRTKRLFVGLVFKEVVDCGDEMTSVPIVCGDQGPSLNSV